MNKKLLLTILVILISTIAVKGQDQMYDRLAKNKDITSVYVSKTLLSLTENIDMGSANINGLMNKLEGIEIYSAETASGVKAINSEISRISKDKDLEVLMKVKDEEDNVIFYSRKTKNINELLMTIEEPDESTIIRMVGNFTLEDIQNLINDNN